MEGYFPHEDLLDFGAGLFDGLDFEAKHGHPVGQVFHGNVVEVHIL